jgi:hypothetical protein
VSEHRDDELDPTAGEAKTETSRDELDPNADEAKKQPSHEEKSDDAEPAPADVKTASRDDQPSRDDKSSRDNKPSRDKPSRDDHASASASSETTMTTEPPDAFDKALAWLAVKGALPTLGLLTLVVALMYAGVFRGELAGDDLSFHFAESRRIADCIAAGDWDFWNPSANGGFASAYYYQVIPQLASALPTAVFGHHLFWFQLSIFVPLVLAPACAYKGMRLLGAVPWAAVAGAFAIAFTIGASRWGFNADGTFSVGLYTQTWAFAAFPMAYGYAVRWSLEGKGLHWAVAWSAFVGLCHPFAVIGLGIALFFGFLGQVIAHFGAIAISHGTLRVKRPAPRALHLELLRHAAFAVLLTISLLPILVPLVADYAGFGGFPHRVNDEVGPGFKELGRWIIKGQLFDVNRLMVITMLCPIAVVFGRGKFLGWLWVPALVFALLLGFGPHLGKTGDDLLPAVRFLGALQITVALGVAGGTYSILAWLWNVQEGTRRAFYVRYAFVFALVIVIGGVLIAIARGHADNLVFTIASRVSFGNVDSVWLARIICMVPIASVLILVPAAERGLSTLYGIRTALCALVAVAIVSMAVPTFKQQSLRVRTLAEQPGKYRPDMMKIIEFLEQQPDGRKQVGPGAENHWWNLLSYVYARIPSLLMMGGGGLQASPNYDFLWSVRDFAKLAWVYDTPYIVFETEKGTSVPVGENIFTSGKYTVRRLNSDGLVSPIQITGILPEKKTDARASGIAWLRSDLPTKNRHLVYNGWGGKTDEPKATVKRSWRQESPGDEADIVAEIEVSAPTTFVIRESWHPRWHAFIDGKPAKVRRVTPDFPAVDVPAGAKLLQLRFERPWWAQLAWLAWPGAVLAAWLLVRLIARVRST